MGAGTGETAAYLAAAGYTVTAVDISAKNYALLAEVAVRCPGVTALRGDFYTAAIPGRFDAVCLFETFGMGADADQRRLLRRIAAEWLAPGGVVILDVYHRFGPIRQAGSAQSLDRLENVPASVAITERSYYDAILGRWIDEWEPVGDPAAARRQSARCYTPADLFLLLEGTGLKMVNVADLIEHAVQGTVSYPPDRPLPQTHVGPHQTRIEVANETTLVAMQRLRTSGCDCEATPAVTRRVARTLPGARPETCRPLRP